MENIFLLCLIVQGSKLYTKLNGLVSTLMKELTNNILRFNRFNRIKYFYGLNDVPARRLPLVELKDRGVELEPGSHGQRKSELRHDVDVKLVLRLVRTQTLNCCQIRWIGLITKKILAS